MQASYRYNALGQQVTRTLASGQVIDNLFDMEGHRVAEMDRASGTVIRTYVWLGDMPVAVVEGGQVYLVRVDHIGRPVFATTLAGTQVWSTEYLPFGGVHVSTGTPMALRFPGQWFQMESGLHQNWMRDYDPTTGRYIEADPLGLIDGASVYGYARQNPGRYIDPRGESGTTIYVLPSTPVNLGPDWLPVPNSFGSALYQHRCSPAMLRFDFAETRRGPHWHFYPTGAMGKEDQYSPSGGGPHLMPGTPIPVKDCNCPEQETSGGGGAVLFFGIGLGIAAGMSGVGGEPLQPVLK